MGSNRTRLAYLVLILAAMGIAQGCRRAAPSRLSAADAGEIRGALGVVYSGPRGDLAAPVEAEEIVAVFDHPMAPLSDRPFDDSTAVLKIEPAVEGTFRWMGTRAVSFRPRARLPYATDFKVTIPAGTRSLDGYAIREDYTWTFETIRPQLVRHYPANEDRQLRLETEPLLVFNQAVESTVIRDFLTLTGSGESGREAGLAFDLSRPEAKALEAAGLSLPVDRAVVVKPRAKLRPGFSYALELRAGLSGREGRLTMKKNETFVFTTFNAFRFEGLEAAPGQSPDESLQFRFSNRVNYKEFTSRIKIDPPVQIPDHYADADYDDQTLWINLPLRPETEYTLTIPADLPDDFGNVLGRAETVKFSTGSLVPFVRMTSGSGVIESYGELTYPLFAVNNPPARIRAARLTADQVIPLLTAPRVFSGREAYQPTAAFYSYNKPLALRLPRNERGFAPISLRDIEPDGRGFLFLQLETETADDWARFSKAFLQLTGLGITGKFSPENNVLWTSFLRSGQSAPAAEVEIRDDANRILWRGRTDAEGRVETPGWKALGLRPLNRWTKPRQWVFARLEDDVAMISSDESTGVEPYRFDINFDWNPEPRKVQGAVFSERGIYRAGEKVHLKGLLRQLDKGRWTLPSVKEIACEIQDPFMKTVSKTTLSLDDYGSFHLDFESREDAALGVYTIAASLPASPSTGSETKIVETFRLEAFRAAEFEVHLKSPRDSYVFGDSFEGEIRAGYLFGGAMSGQKADWTLRLNPSYFTPPGPRGFLFGDQIDSWDEDQPAEQSRLVGSGEALLDKDGRLGVKVPLRAEKERGTVSADLEATVQSPSRRSISNRIQTIVHQGAFYIGLKPSTTFLKKGDPLSVQVVSVLPDGSPQTGKNITVKLMRREWRSARKAGLGGRLEWITEKIDTETASQAVRTAAAPVEVGFRPDRSGLYFIFAEAKDGAGNRISTAVYLYVTGGDYVAWERMDDDAVELVADAKFYKPGETARILVKSPYEKAKALVTIEREFILRSEVVEITGSSAEIGIPVTAEMIPNAFVSVLLIQGRTANAAPDAVEDAGKPSFKIGYANLRVDPDEKRIRLEIQTDQPLYKPGDSVEIRLHTVDAQGAGVQSNLALAVVDVGVINLIGYQTPDPFGVFYGERALSVDTSESRVHVVGQRHFGEKGDNPGGGGSEGARGLSLSEVQLRGDFKSTAYWTPSLTTDPSGAAVVRFKLPDNLTTFRIMTVVQTKDSRFGRGEKDFKVVKPVLMLPALPRFARVGDTFQGGVLLTNNTSGRGTVRLSLQAEGIEAQGPMERSVDLAPGESREILFSLASAKPGSARLAFRAVLNGASDGLEAIVPIELPRPLVSVGLTGQTDTSQEETVIIPKEIHPDLGEVHVQASSSALTGLQARLQELENYPYQCLEQRLSRVLPFILAPRLIRDFRLSPLSPEETDKMIRSTLREVYACQKENGGFSLWPDSPFDSPYVTSYAVFALLKAYEAGIPIDRSRLDSGLAYLKAFLQAKHDPAGYPYDRRGWSTVQAFALYDLALAGRPESAYTEKLFQERDRLTLFGRAMLLKAMRRWNIAADARQTLIREFLNQVRMTSADAHFEESDPTNLEWIYSSNMRTTAIILQALLEAGSTEPFLSGAARWMVRKKSVSGWPSTQDNFFVFYALNEYYQTVEKSAPDFRASLLLAEKMLLDENFRGPTASFQASAPLTAFPKGRNLPFRAEKSGPGHLFFNLRVTYAPLQALPPRDEGLAIYKRIETLDGRPLTDVAAGTLAVVTLEVAVPKESLFLVVDDPLPAGFEAVLSNFLTESEERQRAVVLLSESDGRRPWEAGWNHVEIHDNRVLLFAESLGAGIHRYRYLVRALTFGTFGAPGPRIQQMYAPEIFGRGSEQLIKIVK
jgi:hypothetical protein